MQKLFEYLRKALALMAIVALSWVPVFGPAKAEAGVGLFATEITQLLNNVQLVNQYLQQVMTVQNLMAQYQDMLKQGFGINNQQFGPIMQDLQQLAQAVQGGQALSYSMANLSGQFQQRFPGYQQPSGLPYSQQYQQWSRTALDTITGTLRAVGLHGDQLQNEQAVINALRDQSQTAEGRMQAITVGNEIAEQQVEQLQKLRELMLTDIQSKATYQGYALQQDSNKQADTDSFFAPVQHTSDGVRF